jgi:hypothetical protein
MKLEIRLNRYKPWLCFIGRFGPRIANPPSVTSVASVASVRCFPPPSLLYRISYNALPSLYENPSYHCHRIPRFR